MQVKVLPGLAALVELPAVAAAVSIRTAFGFLLRALGAPRDVDRSALPHAVPAAAAVALLQLLSENFPEDVDLHDVAAALASQQQQQQQQHSRSAGGVSGVEDLVQLDALLGLCCLISSGSTQDKLQLCFWALDRDSSGSLDLQQVLGLVPAARLAAAAARIILQETSLQALTTEALDPQAAAASSAGCDVLREVLTRAFLEADPQHTRVIQPGEQLVQLLFAAAAQLTSIMVGAAAGSASREGMATGYGSSRASSASTTPPRSALVSPFVRQAERPAPSPHQHQHQLQHEQQAQQSRPQQPRTSLGQDRHLQTQTQTQQLEQQQQHTVAAGHTSDTPAAAGLPDSSSVMADVVIMDSEGGLLHYQTPVQEAAAAACQRRAPPGPSDAAGVRVYGPPTRRTNSGNGTGGGNTGNQMQQGLMPASSLLQHLEYLEAQQQQQDPNSTDSGSGTALFLTPGGTGTADEDAALPGGEGSNQPEQHHHQHSHPAHHHHLHHNQQQPQQEAQQQPGGPPQKVQLRSGLTQLNLRGATRSSPGSSASNSLRKIFVGSPFGTISESANTGGTGPSSGEGKAPNAATDGAADAVPATAAGAITHTATNVMTTIQSNILAVVVKLLLNCGVCFLVTTMVVLGDAALVTGLHLGAHMSLSVSFAIAVAVNMVLVLLLLALLLAVRFANAANNSRLADVANSPEAQQLDQIVETMKAAVQALKTSEQQQQLLLAGPLGAGSASNRYTGSHFITSRASSMRGGDLEQGGSAGRRELGGPAAVGMAGRVPSGPLAVAGKLRAVWSAVGKVAGFLPPAQGSSEHVEGIAGPFGSAVQLEPGVAGQQHSSTSWGASSGPEGVGPAASAGTARASEPLGGKAAAGPGSADAGPSARQGFQQSRQLRVAGTPAPQSAPGVAPVALREAYPQL